VVFEIFAIPSSLFNEKSAAAVHFLISGTVFASQAATLAANKSESETIENRAVEDAILSYLRQFDMNLSLLVDLSVEEIVEIVRMLDVLGAEKRLREYEVVCISN
jgi:hypothetical protein